VTAPRGLEGSLPPCIKIAVFEGKRAMWHDFSGCGHPREFSPLRFTVNVAEIVEWKPLGEGGINWPWVVGDTGCWQEATNDPDEAERLWLEACERLRVMP